jgi:hypothetical protein
VFSLPAGRRVGPRWLLASAATHALVIGGMFAAYRGFVHVESERASIVAVALPVPRMPRRALPQPPARGGAAPRTTLAIPAAVPTSIPAPRPAAADSHGVVGGVPGGVGIAMSPTRGDPRLWVQPMYIPEGGGRAIDMDSVVRRRMAFMAGQIDSIMRADSLSPLANPFATPRWTFDHNGKKYGLDAQGIHFGSFTIPTAVLALLPFPQGNIDQARANARVMDMRADILRAAARAEAEEDFRRAVAQIRARKDRERREQRDRDSRERRDGDRPIP